MLPFFLVNWLVGAQGESFIAWLRPTGNTSIFEHVLLAILIGLMIVGSFITIHPVLKRDANGKRDYKSLNLVIGIMIGALALFIAAGFVAEIFSCDILQLANCD